MMGWGTHSGWHFGQDRTDGRTAAGQSGDTSFVGAESIQYTNRPVDVRLALNGRTAAARKTQPALESLPLVNESKAMHAAADGRQPVRPFVRSSLACWIAADAGSGGSGDGDGGGLLMDGASCRLDRAWILRSSVRPTVRSVAVSHGGRAGETTTARRCRGEWREGGREGGRRRLARTGRSMSQRATWIGKDFSYYVQRRRRVSLFTVAAALPALYPTARYERTYTRTSRLPPPR